MRPDAENSRGLLSRECFHPSRSLNTTIVKITKQNNNLNALHVFADKTRKARVTEFLRICSRTGDKRVLFGAWNANTRPGRVKQQPFVIHFSPYGLQTLSNTRPGQGYQIRDEVV